VRSPNLDARAPELRPAPQILSLRRGWRNRLRCEGGTWAAVCDPETVGPHIFLLRLKTQPSARVRVARCLGPSPFSSLRAPQYIRTPDRRGILEPDEPLSVFRNSGGELQTDTTARIDDSHALVILLPVLLPGVGRLNIFDWWGSTLRKSKLSG
jgi:hypothetical protein